MMCVLWLCLCAIMLAACGNDKSGEVVVGQYYYPESTNDEADSAATETEEAEVTPTVSTDMYLIISNDMTKENMILEQLASGKQYMYYYSLTTSFQNKYGDRTTVSEFEAGRIINIGEKDSDGKLKMVRICDDVWEYPDITRYSVDEERGIFTIADTKYSFDSDLFVVSNGEQIRLSALNELDEIRVIGIGKQLLSVTVTTGHGELKLENTSLFDGSYIQIGDKIFAEVTPNMTMDIPEGTYLVTVANNGYGGSTEIVVERNETTVVDLDTLKGEGPKFGSILFAIDVADATLRIDGKEVDYSQAQELQYGIHSIIVNADGYDAYSKKLFVNSAEATILIELTDSDTVTTADSDDTDSSSTSTATDSSSTTSSSTSTGSSTTSSTSTDDVTADYLSTLSELLSTVID